MPSRPGLGMDFVRGTSQGVDSRLRGNDTAGLPEPAGLCVHTLSQVVNKCGLPGVAARGIKMRPSSSEARGLIVSWPWRTVRFLAFRRGRNGLENGVLHRLGVCERCLRWVGVPFLHTLSEGVDTQNRPYLAPGVPRRESARVRLFFKAGGGECMGFAIWFVNTFSERQVSVVLKPQRRTSWGGGATPGRRQRDAAGTGYAALFRIPRPRPPAGL